jgi:hypothetical protein
MALLSLAARWFDDVELVAYSGNTEPESAYVSLGYSQDAEISGVPTSPEGPHGQEKISFRLDPDGLFQPIRLLEETDYQLVVKLPISRDNCLQLKKDAPNPRIWPFLNPRLRNVLQVVVSRLWMSSGGYTLIPVLFNSRAQIGNVDLSILDSDHQLFAEVMTGKIAYETEYKRLLSDIADYHLQLSYSVGAASSVTLQSAFNETVDLATALFHIRKLMLADELPSAIEMVIARPLSALSLEEIAPKFDRGGRVSAALLAKRMAQLHFRAGGPLKNMFRGFTPQKIPLQRNIEKLDIAENRYIKNFLNELRELLSRVLSAAQQDNNRIAIDETGGWIDRVDEWLREPLWTDVHELTSFPANSQRLMRTAGYQDVLKADVSLRQALALAWQDLKSMPEDAVYADIRPISELYEYWCYFVIRDLLHEIFDSEAPSEEMLIIKSKGGLGVRLAALSDGTATVFKDGDVSLSLFYSRSFQPHAEAKWGKWAGSYSVTFDPDISLALKTTSGLTHWLNFDAKYKLQRFTWTDTEGNAPNVSGDRDEYKHEDLNKMHCYRDAILGTRGAYILFPGQGAEENLFARKSAEPRTGFWFPGVGAFPLRPGNLEHREMLRTFLRDAIATLKGASSYQEETGTA